LCEKLVPGFSRWSGVELSIPDDDFDASAIRPPTVSHILLAMYKVSVQCCVLWLLVCSQEDLIRKILSKPFKIPIRDYKGMLCFHEL